MSVQPVMPSDICADISVWMKKWWTGGLHSFACKILICKVQLIQFADKSSGVKVYLPQKYYTVSKYMK